jgi:energy-coupling factor transport system permease protein
VISLRYQERDTPVHRLNPFAKLGWLLSVLVLALIVDNPVFLLGIFLSTLPLVGLGRVFAEWRSFMKLAGYLSLFIILINALVSNQGAHVLAAIPVRLPLVGSPVITLEAIIYGAAMSLRLAVIISAFALLTLTTHPDDMMLALLKLRLPFKSVLVTSLATRFIPTLLDDLARVSDVQRSRGLELDRGRLTERIRNRSSVVMVLLANSLDRAVQVAEAMESRAFGSGNGRTFYHDLSLNARDKVATVLSLLPLALGVFLAVSNYGEFWYYPNLQGLALGGLEWGLVAVMILLLLAPVILESRGSGHDSD